MSRDAGVLASRLARAKLDWILPGWKVPGNVHAFFTTRHGPAGTPFDVGPAHLGGLDDRSRGDVLGNRGFVASMLPSPPVYLEQVHGADVARVDGAPQPLAPWPVADAAVTRGDGVVLAVRVADCLPVLFADDSGSVVAAAHAGWRGLAAGVLEATVRAMEVLPASVRAWIGPGIGPESFEVGDDVFSAFVDGDPGAQPHFIPLAGGKWMADLPSLARRRLAATGITTIESCGLCTVQSAERFYSYRREGSSGRMAAYIWRSSPAGD